jgi:chaperonin GroEL
VTDALCATKAAISEGIVVGGGVALLYASRTLDQLKRSKDLSEGELAGIKIVQSAVRIPAKIIAKNAGFEGELIVGNI